MLKQRREVKITCHSDCSVYLLAIVVGDSPSHNRLVMTHEAPFGWYKISTFMVVVVDEQQK